MWFSVGGETCLAGLGEERLRDVVDVARIWEGGGFGLLWD